MKIPRVYILYIYTLYIYTETKRKKNINTSNSDKWYIIIELNTVFNNRVK